MKMEESDKLVRLFGQTLRTPGASPAAGKPAWYVIPERTDALVSAVYTGGGNSVGFLRGEYRSADGLAVLDFAALLEEQAQRRKKK